MNTVSLGAGEMHSMRMGDYYSTCKQAFLDDLFVWLREEPKEKSYRI